MALVDAKVWIEENFQEGSKPDLRTVRQWVASRQIPGELIGPRKIYIDNRAWQMRRQGLQATSQLRSRQPLQVKLTGDPTIDNILLSK